MPDQAICNPVPECRTQGSLYSCCSLVPCSLDMPVLMLTSAPQVLQMYPSQPSLAVGKDLLPLLGTPLGQTPQISTLPTPCSPWAPPSLSNPCLARVQQKYILTLFSFLSHLIPQIVYLLLVVTQFPSHLPHLYHSLFFYSKEFSA